MNHKSSITLTVIFLSVIIFLNSSNSDASYGTLYKTNAAVNTNDLLTLGFNKTTFDQQSYYEPIGSVKKYIVNIKIGNQAEIEASSKRSDEITITSLVDGIEDKKIKFSILTSQSLQTLSSIDPATNHLTYTADSDHDGYDNHTLKATSKTVGSDPSVTILATNSPPTAADQSYTLDEDAISAMFFSGSDPDGDQLTYSIVEKPDHGKLYGFNSGTGYVAYKPDKDYNGADSIKYKVSDGKQKSNTATALITINPLNEELSFFGTPVNISSNAGGSFNPQIIVADEKIYMAWHDNTGAGSNDIFFKKITPSKTVDTRFSVLFEDNFPKIAKSGNNVYMLWRHVVGYGSTILDTALVFVSSPNDGDSFKKLIQLDEGNEFIFEPEMIASDGNVYLTWYQSDIDNDFDIMFAKSTDSGKSFEDTINISSNVGASLVQKMALSGNTLYVVWRDETFGDGDILISKSTDGGTTFSEPLNVSNNAGVSTHPQISVMGDTIYLAWGDATTGEGDIYFAKSTDEGTTFSEPLNVSNNSGLSIPPNMLVSGDTIYLAWFDQSSGLYDVLFAKSTDGGTTFSEPVTLQNNSGDSIYPPEIIELGSNLYLLWNGYYSVSYDTYFAKSTDGGTTFETENLTYNPGESYGPETTVADDTLFLTWFDSTPGDFDVFLTSNTNSFTLSLDGATENSDIQLSVSGKYVCNNKKIKIDKNELFGSMTIDNQEFELQNIKLAFESGKKGSFKISGRVDDSTTSGGKMGAAGTFAKKIDCDTPLNVAAVTGKSSLTAEADGITYILDKSTLTGQLIFDTATNSLDTVTGTLTLLQSGTATLSKDTQGFSKGPHTVVMEISSNYNYSQADGLVLDNDSITGSLEIDDTSYVITITKFTISSEFESIIYAATVPDEEGVITGKVSFKPALDFEGDVSQEVPKKKSALKVIFGTGNGKVVFDTKNTSTASIE